MSVRRKNKNVNRKSRQHWYIMTVQSQKSENVDNGLCSELCEIERRRIPRIFIRMNESMDEFISHPIVSTYLKGGKE
jgi:hypothetical protein